LFCTILKKAFVLLAIVPFAILLAWVIESNHPIKNVLAECRYEVTLHGHDVNGPVFRSCMEARGFIPDYRIPYWKAGAKLYEAENQLPISEARTRWRWRGWARASDDWSR
jgi:hypothetical protein